MVIHYKTSLRQRNEEIAAAMEVKTEVSELQDAVVDLAAYISEVADNTAGGDNDG